MKNDYGSGEQKISIPPTLLFTAVTTIADIRTACTSDFKKPGSFIFLVGATRRELGGSELYNYLGFTGNDIPRVDTAANRRKYQKIHLMITAGLIKACHDLSDGGLAIALSEACIGSGLGADIELKNLPEARDMQVAELLFSETPGRFIIEIAPEDYEKSNQSLADIKAYCIGRVTSRPVLTVKNLKNKKIASLKIARLKRSWQSFRF